MAAHTTPEQRQSFYAHHQHGATYAVIAEQAGVSVECVRYWCRRQRDGGSCQSQYAGRRVDCCNNSLPWCATGCCVCG